MEILVYSVSMEVFQQYLENFWLYLKSYAIQAGSRQSPRHPFLFRAFRSSGAPPAPVAANVFLHTYICI